MASATNVVLPQELVHEIMLRLSVKALVRCKCVCKQWYDLIESSSFIEQHYDHKSNDERLLIRLKKDRRGYKFVLYVDEALSSYQELSHPRIVEAEHSNLVGPLNGVFCVGDVSVFGSWSLWNPALNQFKPLPHLDSRIRLPNSSAIGNELGLGLDPLTGDHKLVLILYFWRDSHGVADRVYYSDYYSVVCVCTKGSDSWRVLEDVDPIVSRRMANTSLSNTYSNGVYYWLLEFKFIGITGTDVAMVLAFDMRTEKFRVMEVRDGVSESEVGTLAVCGESLNLLMFDRSKRCIEVWMMEDEDSWIRSSKIGPLDDIYWVLCFWRNNELLLETMDSFLALYNVSTQELRAVEAQKGDGDCHLNWSYVYKESLVSVEGEMSKSKISVEGETSKSKISVEGETSKSKIGGPSSGFISNFFKCLSI